MDKEDQNGYFIKIINSVHKSICCCQNKICTFQCDVTWELQAWCGFSAEESFYSSY